MAVLTLQEPLTEMMDELGLTAYDIAAALNVDPRAVNRWRNDGSVPQREIRPRVAALLAFVDHLHNTFKSAGARRTWLESRSRYLGGLTRAEVIRAGRIDRVEADLIGLDEGVFE